MATLPGLVKDASSPPTDTQTSPISVPDGTTLLTTKQHNQIVDYLSGDAGPNFIPQLAIDSLVVDLAARELTANKGAINGYAPLGSTSLVPTENLGTDVADATTFLRGDGTWTVPPGGGEINTSSNAIIDSSTEKGFALAKDGLDLPFRVMAIGSTNMSIASDADKVTIDVLPANLTGIPQSGITNLVTDLSNKEDTANKGAVSGYAGLDASQKLLLTNFPSGTALQVLRRNAGNTALEFADASGAEVFTWTAPHSMATFKLTAAAANDVILNAPSGQGVSIEVAGSPRYLFNDTEADWKGNDLINMGIISFDTLDNSIQQDVNDLHYDVVDGGSHMLRIKDVLEYNFTAGELFMENNNLRMANGDIIFNLASIREFATNLEFNVVGGIYILKESTNIIYQFSATQAEFFTNNIVQLGAFHQMSEIADPSPPGAAIGILYLKDVSGRTHLHIIDDFGVVDIQAGDGAGTLRLVKLEGTTLSTDREGLNFADTATINFTVTDDAGNDEADVIAAIVNDSVVDAQIGAHISTKITITAKGQLNSAIVYNDQTNAWTTGLQDFSAVTLRIPVSATPSVTVDGDIAFDSLVTDFTTGLIKFFGTEEQGIVAMPIAQFTTPSDGAVPTYNATNDEFELVVPAGAGDMILAAIQTVTGAKTFEDTRFFLRNVADTFSASFVNTITADRIYTLPDAAGTIVITGLASQITLGNEVTGAITNLSDVTAKTGTGTIVVFDTSPTLVTPNLGTPSTLVLTNATGLPPAGVIGVAAVQTDNLSVFATTTSAQLAGVIDDETGTGALVFGTAPTIDSPSISYAINAQTGTSYTTVLLDAGKIITSSNASAVTVTIPPNSSVAYPIGSSLTVISIGVGLTSFAQGAGVTITSTGAVSSAPVLRAQFSSATAIKTGTDAWSVVGDIA